MGIEILLFLQELRNSLGGYLDEIFNGFSKVSVVVMPLLPVVIYWCVSTKWGKRFMATICCGEVINGLIKLTVCAYRPWIRSELIEPAGDSKVAATGYSFPSGHTMNATATYGTLAVWQHKKRRWIAVTCGILIFITMFSRLILGVHTPQDVLAGFAETSAIIFLMEIIIKWADEDNFRVNALSIIGILGIITTLVYIIKKPYPMDYVDGKILVDPVMMMRDCFMGCGELLGFIIGLYIDRRWIHYEVPADSPYLAVVTAVGVGLAFSWNEYFAGATVSLLFGRNWGAFAGGLIFFLFVTAVYPLFIMRMCRPEQSNSSI